MKRIEGTIYYSIRELSIILSRNYKTVLRWVKVSDQLRKKDRPGLLPEPRLIGKANFFTKNEVKLIQQKIKGFKRGTFKEFEERKTAYQRLKEENQTLKNKIKEMERGME